MDILDIFKRNGTLIPKGEAFIQNPVDQEQVCIVVEGKALVYLSALNENGENGARKFLFEVEKGRLIFGMTREEDKTSVALQAVPYIDSAMLCMEFEDLVRLVEDEKEWQQLNELNQYWIKEVVGVLDSTNDDIAATGENLINPSEYLRDSDTRHYIHSKALSSMEVIWRKQIQEEACQRQERKDNDQRLMLNSLSQLAAIHEKKDVFFESSGDILSDSCHLIGQAMGISITVPTLSKDKELTLGAIARASHIRMREVSLNGTWYREDGGPILGYLKEDGRPIALIPKTPDTYILHDSKNSTQEKVDKKVASQISDQGVVFYKSFPSKKIGLKELLMFGLQGCWKQDLIRILLMGAFGGLLGTAIPFATGLIFDYIIPEGDKGALLQIGLVICATALAAMLFQLTRALASQRMEGRLDGVLQAAVWDRLLSLPVPFFKQYSAGELAMRAMGISQIRSILSGTTINSILSGIFSIFTFAVLFYYDTKLAGVAALLVFVSVVIMVILAYKKVKYEHTVLAVSNRITGLILQLIGSVTKFKVAGAQSRAFAKWAKEFSIQRKLTYQKEKVSHGLIVFYAVFPVLSGLVIFYVQSVSANPLPTSKFIGFYAAFISFLLSMVGLANSLIGANLVFPLYQRAKPILETIPEDDDTKLDPGVLNGEIEVNHISFRYQADGPLVLKDVSFHINEGDYVALVGTSGCGKSTLFRILLGFESPEKGNVYYSGQDLSKIDVRAIRRQLGVVLQNGQLMTGSIYDNIVGSNPYLTMDDAWEAAAKAGVEEDIREMPMGMHTVISEGASTISGGQKQRIMIARAIINRPQIIYFDEATSALDNITQAIVSQSLDELKSTRIVIAHRLSTILNCDKILVMDNGRIAETGTYQELMDRNGVFAGLVKRQLA